MYQQTTIIGNVGSEPELRYTQSGVAVLSLSVAVNKRYKTSDGEQRDETTWFRVTCWRQLAETMAKMITKGKQIMVVGEIGASAYTAKSGEAAASLELTADTVKLLGKREGSEGEGFAPAGKSSKSSAPSDGAEDDIPF